MGWLGLDILAALTHEALTTREVAAAIGGRREDSVRKACRRLHKQGLIYSVDGALHDLTEAGRSALDNGKLITSGPERGSIRRPDGLRARAWRLMRIKRKFGVADLCAQLCDGSQKDPEGNLQQYLLPLVRAGYLAPLRSGRYLLIKDTGPLAPAWNKLTHCLTDPNTGEQHNLGGACGIK